MLKELVNSDICQKNEQSKCENKKVDIPLEVTANQYNHPYYANQNSYNNGQFFQSSCPTLPTSNHNPVSFQNLITNDTELNNPNLTPTISSLLPSSINMLFSLIGDSISGLITELLQLNKGSTINDIIGIFLKEHRLFYLGLFMIIIYLLHYILHGIFYK